jgi:hypothetical protein
MYSLLPEEFPDDRDEVTDDEVPSLASTSAMSLRIAQLDFFRQERRTKEWKVARAPPCSVIAGQKTVLNGELTQGTSRLMSNSIVCSQCTH